MRPVAAAALMFALAVWAAPAPVRAFEWTGQLGVLYTRDDAWAEQGPRTTRPHLDLDLRLDVADFVRNPGTLTWNAGIGYRRVSDDLNGAHVSRTDAVSYRLSAALFRNPTSPFRLSGFATRSDARVESPGSVAASSDERVATYGGTLSIAPPALPGMQIDYHRTEIDEAAPSLEPHRRAVDRVRAQASHGTTAFSASGTYDGEWSDGTWVADQYQQYVVRAEGHGKVTERGELFLLEDYLRREPTATSGPTFAVDASVFSGAYREGLVPGELLSVSYRFTRGLTETPTELAETVNQAARWEQDFPLDASQLLVRTLAEVTRTEQRTAIIRGTSTGETVGALLWWRRDQRGTLVEWNLGPQLGLVQTQGDGNQFGYGGSGAVRTSRPWGGHRATISYDASYQRDLGVRGWTLRQSALAGLSRSVGVGRANLQVSAFAARQWTPVLGDDVRRSISLTAAYAVRRSSLDAQASYHSGAAALARDRTLGDGIFLPLGFDTHALTVVAGAATDLLPSLSGRVQLQGSSTRAPGQPDMGSYEAGASLTYRYGALDFAIEDRYSVIPASGAGYGFRANALMVRASRTIGTRY